MAVNYGRTHSKHVAFLLEHGGSMVELAVNSLNGIGLQYEEMDVTAFMDAIKNTVLGHPDAPIDIGGPFETNSSGTGAHDVLSAANGVETPRSLDIQVGIRHDWESGEPQFGLSASTGVNGYVVTAYQVDASSMTYTASLRLFGGTTAPAWGTAAEVVAA